MAPDTAADEQLTRAKARETRYTVGEHVAYTAVLLFLAAMTLLGSWLVSHI